MMMYYSNGTFCVIDKEKYIVSYDVIFNSVGCIDNNSTGTLSDYLSCRRDLFLFMDISLGFMHSSRLNGFCIVFQKIRQNYCIKNK